MISSVNTMANDKWKISIEPVSSTNILKISVSYVAV